MLVSVPGETHPVLELTICSLGIIGGPPHEGYDPVFYASADDGAALEEFQSLGQYGLKISPLTGEGVGVGDASALKMSYAVRTVHPSDFRTCLIRPRESPKV